MLLSNPGTLNVSSKGGTKPETVDNTPRGSLRLRPVVSYSETYANCASQNDREPLVAFPPSEIVRHRSASKVHARSSRAWHACSGPRQDDSCTDRRSARRAPGRRASAGGGN